MTYATPIGGLPTQEAKLTGKAVFTTAYAVIPGGVMRDIVTSYLPFWEKSRAWVLARPLSGFAETFSQYIVEIKPSGGSNNPEPDNQVESIIFVTSGSLIINHGSGDQEMLPGGYAYCPPGVSYVIKNTGTKNTTIHLFRKRYISVEGILAPKPFTTNEKDIKPTVMEHSKGAWSTTRFVDPEDLRYDMHVNIVNFKPGGVIPFEETHVMEHGIYILEGSAEYLLNKDWVHVEAGDFLWLRAFCPQACQNTGSGNFRYLLYKDVNRHAQL